MFNLDYNSIELQQFCKNISNKKRLFWENLLNSQFSSDISQIRDLLSIDSPRQLLYHIINDLPVINKCVCGNNLTWNTYTKKYLTYCSVTCSTISTADSRKKTNMQKYGVDNYAKSKEFLEKSKSTFIKNYGVSNPSKSDEVQTKKLATNLERYGVPNYSQTHLSLATQNIITDKDRFFNLANGKTISEVADLLGMSYSGPIKIAEKFNLNDIFIRSTRSAYEEKMVKFLDFNDIKYIANSKSIITPYQIDFYIPQYNIGIEVGSMYFHCELSHNKTKIYHRKKWELSNNLGITLLQYFDDDINSKWEIITSKLMRLCHMSLPVIGARKITISSEITTLMEQQFVDKYHIQGNNFLRNKIYVARYLDDIVGIMTFMIKDNQAEIVRYVTDSNRSYPGLFSKMLKTFLRETNFSGLITSFSNNFHSNGNLYKSSGFTLQDVTPPGYFYTKNYLIKESRLKYQKHLLKSKFNLDDNYVDTHSEWQIMQEMGYDRLWDAGQSKWVLEVK